MISRSAMKPWMIFSKLILIPCFFKRTILPATLILLKLPISGVVVISNVPSVQRKAFFAAFIISWNSGPTSTKPTPALALTRATSLAGLFGSRRAATRRTSPKAYSNKIKQKVRSLRNQGWSLGEISLKIKIPKNTLSGWVRDIQLTERQKDRLKQKIIASGVIGRTLAVKVNREKKEKWKERIRSKVKYFEKLPFKNIEIRKLVCGILYLCEGAKYPASRFLYFGILTLK